MELSITSLWRNTLTAEVKLAIAELYTFSGGPHSFHFSWLANPFTHSIPASALQEDELELHLIQNYILHPSY